METIKDILKPLRKEVEAKIQIKEKWLRAGTTILPNSFIFDKRISPQAKALFLVLVGHAFLRSEFLARGPRDCKISHSWLKEELGVSNNWISRYSKELIEIGVMKVQRTGRASSYEIIFTALDERMEWVVKHIKKVRKRLRKEI